MWLLRVGALGYAFSLVRSAQGAWDVLPVESINLDAADRIQFFEGIPSENIQIFDAHAVHGIEATDGSFVLCGMGVEYESLTAPREAFCAKLDGATGAMTHSWRSNATGAPDAINAVLQLPGAGADLVAVGYRSVGGTLSRSMTILALADLTERWTYSDFGDAANLHGAWEFAALTGDKTGLLLGGFDQWSPPAESKGPIKFDFKSYGNTDGGRAVVARYPLSG